MKEPLIVSINTTPSFVTEFVRCISHTILLHRALGNSAFQEYLIDNYDFGYNHCNNKEIEGKVEKIVEELRMKIKNTGTTEYEIDLCFKESVSPWSYFPSFGQGCVWERWCLRISLSSEEFPKDVEGRKERFTEDLRELCVSVLEVLSTTGNHIPDINNTDQIVSFPFDFLCKP